MALDDAGVPGQGEPGGDGDLVAVQAGDEGPLPEPVDLDLYRIRRQAQAGGLINEYRLVA